MYADNDVIPGLEAWVIYEEWTQEESDLMFEEETAGFEQHFAGEAAKDAMDEDQEMTLLEWMAVSDVKSVKPHQVHLHTHFAVGSANFESVTRDIVNVQPQMLLDVVAHLEQEGSVQSLTSEKKRVFTLLSQVKTIAMKLMWGDEMINLDAHMLEMVESIKRGMHLAEDPVAALDFFNFSVHCIMEYLFGWDFEKKRSTEKGSLLDHIRSFYSIGELTEWGMYHMHFLITLYGGSNPVDVHKKMAESDEFQAQFFDLFDDMIHHNLPLDMPFDPEADPRTETAFHVPGPNATKEELEEFLQ
ncbi:hypothetical protein ARMGADRAFT_1035639 [Armillaria gallica]|uniref:Uncharacterized protein n=1 Tax=Armillaria gallica TaxID=47427 RepID=A0A2H3DDZ2_ARMGA|nr:hypothetical protein ARMGADRAFT_1035639 [Armillaria gallica]